MLEFMTVLSSNLPALLVVGVILVVAAVLIWCQYSYYFSDFDPFSAIASILIITVLILIILNSCKSEAAPVVTSAAERISRSFKSVP